MKDMMKWTAIIDALSGMRRSEIGEKKWVTNLSVLFCGKALTVYAIKSPETTQIYDELNSAILRRCDLMEDGFKILCNK